MKLILGNSVSILIREEDFTEITVGLEEISYLRPSGGKATIKFPQASLPFKTKNEVEDEKPSKREEIRAAAELARVKRREIWSEEQNKRDEELRRTISENYEQLKTMMNTLNSNFQKKIEEVEKSQATQILNVEKYKREGLETTQLLFRVNQNLHRLEVSNTDTLAELNHFSDQVRTYIVNAHNFLCADVEEMDLILEKIHGNRYNNTGNRRGKRKIIFKGRQT